MATQVLDTAALEQLDAVIKGEVITADRHDYDDAREVFNRLIDRRPGAIVRCKDPADVIACVEVARANALEVAVRGGGHAVSGAAVCDGGLVIDLTMMKRVIVDPLTRTARVQGGATWRDVDAATQEHGLAVTGGRVPGTGVAGLTLGSGSGGLERKLGFTCDSLVGADVVTADGRFVRATEHENEDLLWGLKGGGGNFGVVTQFEFRLHPVGPIMFGGMMIWPGFMAGDVIRAYREFMVDAPDEVGGALALLTAPHEEFVPEEARGKPTVGIVVTYCGDVEEGERAFEPLRRLGPAMDMTGPMPYTAVQSLIEPNNQPGNNHYWKADFLDSLPDEAVDIICAYHAKVTSPLTALLLQPLGGAVARVAPDATPLARRDAAYAYHLLSQWPTDDHDGDRHIEWTRAVARELAPFATGGVYLTYIGDEGEQRIREAFGAEKYERLVALKDKYDPGNVFRLNQNIRPSTEALARADRPAE